jgi:hypothetical protein
MSVGLEFGALHHLPPLYQILANHFSKLLRKRKISGK